MEKSASQRNHLSAVTSLLADFYNVINSKQTHPPAISCISYATAVVWMLYDII